MAELTLEQKRALARARARARLQKPKDSVLDDVLDVAGEAAAAANRSIMWPVDTAIEGLNLIPGVDLPTTRDLPGADGNFMEPGTARSAIRAAGEAAPVAAGGYQVGARNLAKAGDATLEFLGVGSQSPAALGRQIDPTLPTPAIDTAALPSDKVARELALKRNNSDPARVPYRLNEVGEVIGDAGQKTAVSQGLPEDLVAIVAGANPQERRNMAAMTRVMANADPVARSQNYPRNVLGESLAERVDVVLGMNRRAGQELGQLERRMSGMGLDAGALRALNDGPMNNLRGALDDMGVRFSPETGEIVFSGSALELATAQKTQLKRALGSLMSQQPRTALDVHRKKQALGELVKDWEASSPGGAQGRVAGLLKRVYGDLNGYLRDGVEGYAATNDAFSETADVIGGLNKMIGRNTDIRSANTAPALARASRVVLSNYQNSDEARRLLSELDRLASQGGKEFSDDFLRQNVFLDEAEKLFGTPVRRSLQGEMTKAQQVANVALDQRPFSQKLFDYAGEKFSKSPEVRRKEQLQALLRLISGDS